jgi:hypothetical protein
LRTPLPVPGHSDRAGDAGAAHLQVVGVRLGRAGPSDVQLVVRLLADQQVVAGHAVRDDDAAAVTPVHVGERRRRDGHEVCELARLAQVGAVPAGAEVRLHGGPRDVARRDVLEVVVDLDHDAHTLGLEAADRAG